MANKLNPEKVFSQYKVAPIIINNLIVCIDPSGTVKNGVGHIGIVFFDLTQSSIIDSMTLEITTREKREEHLKYINRLFKSLKKTIKHVVIENYVSYGQQGIGVESETYYVVQAIVASAMEYGLPYSTPMATQHKTRYSEKVLKEIGVDYKKLTTKHERDALKMALYYYQYKYDRKE